jgi:D-threo-aldose 1-dehydrogenase
VRRALELGVGYIDSATLYGHGLAERRVGAALPGCGAEGDLAAARLWRVPVYRRAQRRSGPRSIPSV